MNGRNLLSCGILAASLLILSYAIAQPAWAGKNAGGALIVHTNDSYAYSAGTACTTTYAEPASCAEAITRSDKAEGTVVWLLAAFPDTSSPAVTVVYFGIDYDDTNLDPGSAYRLCGPAGSLEVPDDDWPYAGRGNSVAFGSQVVGDVLFPFYVFRIDGGTEGSYFSTSANPTAGYAALVDDGDPPVMDEIGKFGTLRWYASGANDCPLNGEPDGGGDDSPDGEDDWSAEQLDQWLDGEGDIRWIPNCVLVRLREDLPVPPLGPADSLGIANLDQIGTELGLIDVRRILRLPDDVCSRFLSGHVVRMRFRADTDELDAASRFARLPEVVWAEPDYAYSAELLSPPVYVPSDDEFIRQWPLVWTGDPETCGDDPAPDSCCSACDLGLDTAWQWSRGDSTVVLAFMDGGADMQHPDLFRAYAVNWGEDDGDRIVELCPVDSVGDIGDVDGDFDEDDDHNNYDNDILLGWRIVADSTGWHPSWEHRWDYPNPHGTNVAGILGAITNNAQGVASVAGGDDSTKHAGIRLIQFSGQSPGFFASGWISSFDYARAYGARIYSSSVCLGTAQGEALRDAIASNADSMLFIQATGNGTEAHIACSTARLPGVMAVGGYQCEYGGRWIVPDWVPGDPQGSNYGPELSVLGPTDDSWDTYKRMVLTTTDLTGLPFPYDCRPPGDFYSKTACFGGTSAAAPAVASIAALVFSFSDERHLDLTPAQVREVIEHTAEDVQCDTMEAGCRCYSPDSTCAVRLLGWDRYTGYGRADAGRALTLPIAVLDSLVLPHGTVVMHDDTLHLSWHALDINTENGTLDDAPAKFSLAYLLPDSGLVWYSIVDSIPVGQRSYDWVVPQTVTFGPGRRIRLSVKDSGGNENHDYSDRFQVVFGPASESESVSAQPQFTMGIIGPNPTGNDVAIEYNIRVSMRVRILVLDVAGRAVRTIRDSWHNPGSFVQAWDCRDDKNNDVPSGIYFIKMDFGSSTRLRRLVRVR